MTPPMLHLPDLYLVMTHFGSHGLGACGDPSESRDSAYDGYVEAIEEHGTARVLRLEFDVGSNLPETFRDETHQFEAEYRDVCRTRGLDCAAE